MEKSLIRLCFFCFPFLLSLGTPACFQYSPEDLEGYDSASDGQPETADSDFQPDADLNDGHDEETAACGNGRIDPPDEECDQTEPAGACTTECGTEGTRECVDCRWVCTPPADDNCNGIDEDCSGEADEDYVPATCGLGACMGYATCTGGVEDCTEGSPTGEDDDCNGVDDDCDGQCDDHYTPASTCGVGVCLSESQCSCGTESCTEGLPTGDDDDCNGINEDCDGSIDEHYVPYYCGDGPCRRASQCVGGTESCIPGPPLSTTDLTCNNVDDNCNGEIDEEYRPYYCGLGVCRRPSTCVLGVQSCTEGDPTGLDDNCNALNEDCDLATNEHYEPYTCGVGACQRPSTCISGVESCTPGIADLFETCGNGIDDDCDGSVDEGCCGPCTGAVDVLSADLTGGRFTGSTSGSSAYAGSCGGSDAPEALFTFTTDSTVDVFITTHGSALDTVVYVRRCECSGPEIACSDDVDGLSTSRIGIQDLSPGTYNVFVDGKTASDLGEFQMDLYVTEAGLQGDRCGNPVRLTSAGYVYSGSSSTCNLTPDYSPVGTGSGAGDCGALDGTGDAEEMVFYFWVPSDSTAVSINTCNSIPLSNHYNTSIYIRDVCNGSQETDQLGCNEDSACGSTPSDDTLSELILTLDRGLYYLMVDGYYQASPEIHECGGFRLTVAGL